MRSRSALVPAVLTAAALAAAVLAGCSAPAPAGGLTRYTEVSDLAAAVADRQRTDQTARFTLRGDLVGTGTEAQGPARLRFTGVGAVRITPDDVALQFTQVVTGGGTIPQETGYVVLPDAVYLRMPAPPGQEPERPWVRVDPTSTDPQGQQLIALADTVTERADPTSALLRYAGATTITEAVDDVIEGDPAVRYTIRTDLAQAADGTTDPVLRDQLRQQVDAGLATVTSTLWVDAEHRPLRSAARQDLPGIGTLAVTSTYRDWGQESVITPPPDDEVRAAG